MKKVVIGVSGGVDSSVAAYLLKKEGYDVEGVHFVLKKGVGDDVDALSVCNALGIKYHEADFSNVFSEKVFSRFIDDYRSGLTPNLCVLCNKFVKFGALIDFADSLGADFIATGHYCSLLRENGRTRLLRPSDSEKDQTYFLNQVAESALSRVLFPLAGLTKSEVRKIADEAGLVTAYKKGSSDICLMGETSFRDFIAPFIEPKKGKIITENGEFVGEHDGLFNYTLGQRKGLGLGGKSGEAGRWFVVGKNTADNSLIVSHGSEDALYSGKFTVKNCNWIGFDPPEEFRALCKTRYRQEAQPASVIIYDGTATVKFDEPQRAITPGQFCVFYSSDACLGGGVIE